MKKQFALTALITLVGFNLFSKNPPGTVMIEEGFYMDEAEVSNTNYREYLYWLRKIYGFNSSRYTNALPDTLVWRGKYARNEPLVQYYFRHLAYQQYPVVGVSYEQAEAFCKWRSDRVNEKLYLDAHKNLSYDDLKGRQIPTVYEYKLPTKAQWEKVASAGYSKRIEKKLNRKKYKDAYRHNFSHGKKNANLNDKAGITTEVYSYWPNDYGVYNIIGNVAEMVAEKGIAKGGSWKHKPDKVSVESDFEYSSPAAWIGFRCVCIERE